ncbi:UDP-N-acetylmuramoyl-L-alanyl-D-glutamate--2,6-diaminopimelate ligase [Vandammella animalimorsus]|uniref:Mur ligase family protein n=1 Tax=Vandammella animalimorsus TaxID=2029117 RepID=UPI0031BBB8B5
MSQPPILQQPSQALAWLQQHLAPGASLRDDSRAVQPGDAFFALPSQSAQGRPLARPAQLAAHIEAASAAGAAALLVDAQAAQAWLAARAAGQAQAQALPALALYPQLRQASGEIAALWHGQPSQALDVVAVTGTNGKTTLAWWLAHVLGLAGRPCGYVGTLGVGMPPQALRDTGLTSPGPLLLQAALHDMQRQGASACAIEASSIGLEQARLAGTRIRVAAFTNFTQDHLDYHGSMQAYGAAKRLLFDWPGLQAAVLNAQDAYGQSLRQALLARPGLALWDYAVQADGLPAATARLCAQGVQFDGDSVRFEVLEYAPAAQSAAQGEASAPLRQAQVRARVTGLYSVQNLMALLGMLRAMGLELEQAAQLCRQVPAVPGRMQMLAQPGKPLVVVDYAHTSDALRAVLQALRPVAAQRGGRLSVLFGCGGDRDAGKRPLMAMAAAQTADALWITSDNPRSEDPLAIIAQIETGLTPAQRAAAKVLPERRTAIAAAVAAAAAHDVLLLAGKGHEAYQEIKGVRHPFSDLDEAQQALASWGSAKNKQEEGNDENDKRGQAPSGVAA